MNDTTKCITIFVKEADIEETVICGLCSVFTAERTFGTGSGKELTSVATKVFK